MSQGIQKAGPQTLQRPDWLTNETLAGLKDNWQRMLGAELGKPVDRQKEETINRFRLRIEIAERLQSDSECIVSTLQSAQGCAKHLIDNVVNHFLMLWRSLAPKTVASQ